MTAQKYWKITEEYIQRVTIVLGIFFCSVMMMSWVLIARKSPFFQQHEILDFVGLLASFVISFAVAIWGGVKVTVHVQKWFADHYPKMQDLRLWTKLMGPAETYPIGPEAELAAVQNAILTLNNHGRATNTLIRFRTLGEKFANGFKDGSQERATADSVLENFLNPAAETANREFLLRWKLLVNRCKLLRRAPFTTPVEYRRYLLDHDDSIPKRGMTL